MSATMPAHGYTRYNRRSIRCRCKPCTAANRDATRRYRERDAALALLNQIVWPEGEIDSGWFVIGANGTTEHVAAVEDVPAAVRRLGCAVRVLSLDRLAALL